MNQLETMNININDKEIKFYITKKVKDKLLELINHECNMLLMWITDIDREKEAWSLLKCDCNRDIRYTIQKDLQEYTFITNRGLKNISIPELSLNDDASIDM